MWSSLSVTCGRSVVFPGTPVSSTNTTDLHDIAEILLKVALNTITQPLRWEPLSHNPSFTTNCKVCTYHFEAVGKHLKSFIADPLLVYPCFNWYCVRSLKNCNWNWSIEGIQLPFLQVNPIIGHLNFLLYDWKREVNHPLIKTPQKKNSTHLIYV